MDKRVKQATANLLAKTPYFWRLVPLLRRDDTPEYVTSHQYWESRYASGGTSGCGSVGRLAEFKAEIINDFVRTHNIQSVIELGCGDGSQLALARYERYIGLDVSETAINSCIRRFRGDASKSFFLYDPRVFGDHHNMFHAEAALSLDVIYHLTEDSVFHAYMQDLFRCAERYVIIYSSDFDRQTPAAHVLHRAFARYVKATFPGWRLMKHVGNRYPAKTDDDELGSFSEFFIYGRKSGHTSDLSVATSILPLEK